MIRIKTTKVHLTAQEVKGILLKELQEQKLVPPLARIDDIEIGGPFLTSFELGATIIYAEREDH